MIEIEVCAALAANPTVASIVSNRIMSMDFRATDWENAINYEGVPLSILDPYGYVDSCIVVDAAEINRSLNLRGAGRYTQVVTIWAFTPRGSQGMHDITTLRAAAMKLHEESLPSKSMLMFNSVRGPMDDGKNLFMRIQFDGTFIPGDYKGE